MKREVKRIKKKQAEEHRDVLERVCSPEQLEKWDKRQRDMKLDSDSEDVESEDSLSEGVPAG